MALTDTEHQRIETLQTEATSFVENPITSPSAAAFFGRVADICTMTLSREAEKRKRTEMRANVKAAREKRKTQKAAGGAQPHLAPAESGTTR